MSVLQVSSTSSPGDRPLNASYSGVLQLFVHQLFALQGYSCIIQLPVLKVSFRCPPSVSSPSVHPPSERSPSVRPPRLGLLVSVFQAFSCFPSTRSPLVLCPPYVGPSGIPLLSVFQVSSSRPFPRYLSSTCQPGVFLHLFSGVRPPNINRSNVINVHTEFSSTRSSFTC